MNKINRVLKLWFALCENARKLDLGKPKIDEFLRLTVNNKSYKFIFEDMREKNLIDGLYYVYEIKNGGFHMCFIMKEGNNYYYAPWGHISEEITSREIVNVDNVMCYTAV